MRWIQGFIQKHGEDNYIRCDAKTLTLRALLDEVSVAPFLAEKRLVILFGIPKFSKEDCKILKENIHPSTILLCIEQKGSGRSAGKKAFSEIAELKAFSVLKGRKVTEWMTVFAKQHGAVLTPNAAKMLIDAMGEDQMLLATEIQKLATAQNEIREQDVQRLIVPSSEGVVWSMTSYLCNGKSKEALFFVKKFLERGGDPFSLWTVLLYMLKNVVLVTTAVHSGARSAEEVAVKTGLTAWVVQGILPLAKRISERELTKFVERIVAAEKALKTGGYRVTDESTEELQSLIDAFIMHIPGTRLTSSPSV